MISNDSMCGTAVVPEPCAPYDGWDLHCHTMFSDGTETPDAMVVRAQRLGLHGLAICDHDTTAGWADVSVAARRHRFPVIRGSEITTEFHGVSVHLLGYLYNPDDDAIGELFASTRALRVARARRMVELLAEDYPITWEDVLAQAKKGAETTVGRPHIADALVEAGAYPNRSAAFAGAVSAGSRYYIPIESPSTDRVIRAVRKAGGVAVVAHPGDPSRNRRLLDDDELTELAHAGLDGLELFHRGNDGVQRARLAALARRLGLLVTGGSDWHGRGKPNGLGENVTADDMAAAILERGAIDLVPAPRRHR